MITRGLVLQVPFERGTWAVELFRLCPGAAEGPIWRVGADSLPVVLRRDGKEAAARLCGIQERQTSSRAPAPLRAGNVGLSARVEISPQGPYSGMSGGHNGLWAKNLI